MLLIRRRLYRPEPVATYGRSALTSADALFEAGCLSPLEALPPRENISGDMRQPLKQRNNYIIINIINNRKLGVYAKDSTHWWSDTSFRIF
jgi:hypothetical protein